MDGAPADMGAPLGGETAPANPRAAQVRIRSASAARIGGQRAHDLRIGSQPDYVVEERRHLNRVLVRPRTGLQLRRESEARRGRRAMARAMKSNAGVGVTGIITFGHAAQPLFERLTPDAQDAAYRELAERVAARLDTDLTGLVVHCDESAPHAHFQLTGYDRQGRPLSDQTKRATLRDLQDLTAEVMGRHCPGIERGHSKAGRLKAGAKPAEVVNLSVAELHDRLPHDLAARRARVAEAESRLATLEGEAQAAAAKAEKNERLAETARLKARGEDERAEKASRRLEAYERRAKDARAALGGLTAEREALEARLAELRGQEDQAREAAEHERERLVDLQSRNEEERRALDAVLAEAKRAAGDRDRVRAERDAARTEAERIARTAEAADREAERQRRELVEAAGREALAARQGLSEARQEAEALRGTVEGLRGEEGALRASVAALEAQEAALRVEAPAAEDGAENFAVALREVERTTDAAVDGQLTNELLAEAQNTAFHHEDGRERRFMREDRDDNRVVRFLSAGFQRAANLAARLGRFTRLDAELRKARQHPEPLAQMKNNLDGLREAVSETLRQLGVADQRPDVGERDAKGDPPPVLELVFTRAARKTKALNAELVARLGYDRGGPGM